MADTEWGAVVLDYGWIDAKNTERLVFSYPMDNGIRILSSDYMSLELKPPYYGDTVNLKFWRMLGLNFGTPLPTDVPLTRVPGYIYRYNHTKRTFDAWDIDKVNILHVDNVNSIADMKIDFTIFNSHQFEILFDPGLDGGIRFIFPAKLLLRKPPVTIEYPFKVGVNNIWLPDRIRPYGSIDYDNPTFDIKHIGGIEQAHAIRQGFERMGTRVEFIKLSNLNYLWDIDWAKNKPNNDFVSYFFTIKSTRLLEETVKGRWENLDWLLPILGTNMYPRLMPVYRAGEVHSNRPVYEPWMIMGIPVWTSIDELIDPPPGGGDDPFPHPPPIHTVDPEDEKFEIPVFDLSPNFI